MCVNNGTVSHFFLFFSCFWVYKIISKCAWNLLLGLSVNTRSTERIWKCSGRSLQDTFLGTLGLYSENSSQGAGLGISMQFNRKQPFNQLEFHQAGLKCKSSLVEKIHGHAERPRVTADKARGVGTTAKWWQVKEQIISSLTPSRCLLQHFQWQTEATPTPRTVARPGTALHAYACTPWFSLPSRLLFNWPTLTIDFRLKKHYLESSAKRICIPTTSPVFLIFANPPDSYILWPNCSGPLWDRFGWSAFGVPPSGSTGQARRSSPSKRL